MCVASANMPDDLVSQLEELSERLLGPQDDMGPDKPVKARRGGPLAGGIYFERRDCARCLHNAPRCYNLACVNQGQKGRLTVPGSHAKMYDMVKDADAAMRFNLINLGAQNALLGMNKAPPGLVDALKVQAELTNLPRIGSNCNVLHSNFQLNVASAVEPVQCTKSSRIASLGKFGGGHIDPRDCPVQPTAMSVMSRKSDDVEPENFYMLELGIGWRLEPLSTLYFSGLHFHGGSQPVYKSGRTDKNHIYYRLALIAYPPEDIISGQDSIGFASLPNKSLLPVGYGFRQAYVSCSLCFFFVNGLTGIKGPSSGSNANRQPLLVMDHYSWSLAAISATP
jgi:hypothetical protein